MIYRQNHWLTVSSRAPTPSPAPTSGGRVQKYLLQKRFVAPNSLPPLVGAGLGVGAREPHRSLPPSGTSGGFLHPMGASDFDPAAFCAQAQFATASVVRRIRIEHHIRALRFEGGCLELPLQAAVRREHQVENIFGELVEA